MGIVYAQGGVKENEVFVTTKKLEISL